MGHGGVNLLTQKINDGERVSDLESLFPGKTKQQIHSKVSLLKQKGAVHPTREGLAPSLRSSNELLHSLVAARHERDSSTQENETTDSVDCSVDLDDKSTEASGGLDEDTEYTPSLPVSPIKRKLEASLPSPFTGPEKSPTKKIKPNTPLQHSTQGSSCPFVFWTFGHLDDWYLVVRESQGCSFQLGVDEDGVNLTWQAESPNDFHTILDIPLTNITKSYMQDQNGSFFIKAPSQIESNPRLVEKIPCSDFRILKIPWKIQINNMF